MRWVCEDLVPLQGDPAGTAQGGTFNGAPTCPTRQRKASHPKPHWVNGKKPPGCIPGHCSEQEQTQHWNLQRSSWRGKFSFSIRVWLRWEGTSGSIRSNTCLSRDTHCRCPGPHPGSFWRSPRRRSHSLWAACASALPPAQHNSAAWCSERAARVSLFACGLLWNQGLLALSLRWTAQPYSTKTNSSKIALRKPDKNILVHNYVWVARERKKRENICSHRVYCHSLKRPIKCQKKRYLSFCLRQLPPLQISIAVFSVIIAGILMSCRHTHNTAKRHNRPWGDSQKQSHQCISPAPHLCEDVCCSWEPEASSTFPKLGSLQHWWERGGGVIESSPLSCAARCPSSLSLPRAQMFKPLSFKSQEELFHSHHTSKWELLFFSYPDYLFQTCSSFSCAWETQTPLFACPRETRCPTAPLTRLQAAEGGEALSPWSPVLHCMVRKAGAPSSAPSSPEGKPFFPDICFIQIVSWGKDSD